MVKNARLLVLTVGLAGLTTTLPGDVPCCELRYRVRPLPDAGVVEVDLRIHGFRGDSLVLARPSGRPLVGLLGEDPDVDGVRNVRWSLVDGAPRWTFRRPADGWKDPVRVRYRLAITAERPLNAWSVGLDDDLLYAPAEALFLLPETGATAAQHARVTVRWELPDGWDAMTGWAGNSFHGTRTLVKTNVLAGRIDHRRASACGIEIELGVHGAWEFSPEALEEDLGALACTARRRLGEPAVDRFAVSLVRARFPMTSGNRNGPHAIGLVHAIPDGSPPPTRLLAHEIVHLWQRFDSPAWFHEGVNDYMAIRLAHESGLLDDDGLATRVAAVDSVYRAHPKSGRWSFADEAREAAPFGPSDTYLAYRKGAVVGLALDRELRLRTGGRADLASLWREMNGRASRGHVAWSDADIAGRAAALAGGSLSRFFDHYVEGTTALPPTDALLANLPSAPDPAVDRPHTGAIAVFLQAALSRLTGA